jgi:hypothetical protein
VLAERWKTRAEQWLHDKGCDSSLGSVLAVRFWGVLMTGPVSLCRTEGRALLTAQRLTARVGFSSTLTLEGLTLDVGRLWPGAHPVELGGLQAVAKGRGDGGAEVTLIGDPGGDEVARFQVKRDAAQAQVAASVVLEKVARWTGTSPLEAGVLSFSLRTPRSSSRAQGNAEVTAHLGQLVLRGEPWASEPVGPWSYSVSAGLRWDAGSFQVSSAVIRAGPTETPLLTGDLNASREGETFALSLQVAPAPLSTLVMALPPGLRLPPGVPTLDAPLVASLQVQGPWKEPGLWAVHPQLDLAPLRKASGSAPWVLRGPFIHTPLLTEGAATREVLVGPQNPAFVSLTELPNYLVRAVTISEDAGFFGHPGFDFEELRLSLLDPEERKRQRGASTLTQQLAKNLYFSRERTYERKVREALVTLTLESVLSKSRILELYLNLIEWGPGIYGIGEAAQHYFGVDARALSPKQAAFLATIIPNPTRYSVYQTRGAVTDRWAQRVQDLLDRMRDSEVLSPEAYEEASTEPLTFRPAGTSVRTTW